MFSLTVRDRFMVAHSFTARCSARPSACTARRSSSRRRSGAPSSTRTASSSTSGGLAGAARGARPVEYRNLDDVEEFAGRNTSTEFLCRWIADRLSVDLGPAVTGLAGITVLLRESDVAWAAYEKEL